LLLFALSLQRRVPPYVTDCYTFCLPLGLAYHTALNIVRRVVEKVNSLQTRHPWSFLWSAVTSILSYAPQSVQITVDGKAWYGGTAFLVAVMNGNTFGRGMQIAPNAKVDDGLLEVVLVRGVSRLEILSALWQVYAATHLTHPAVLYCQAHEVRIQSTAKMPFELDGEYMSGNDVTLRVKDGALSLLG
jgi:diacylglycerol kinase (ATP)